MTTFVYDDTFMGFLTVVFAVYEYRCADACIRPASNAQEALFGDSKIVESNELKAERVWKGLANHLNAQARNDIYKAFLSEQKGVEDMLLQYIRYVFASGDVSKDYSNVAALYVADTCKKVHREKHRMEAFIRFKQTADNLYYATIEPDFNVLPLISAHFEKRYADQRWMIYDLKRGYGIYYDLNQVDVIEIDFEQKLFSRDIESNVLDEAESAYAALWQNYFRSVNIESRKNPKLHRRHMPLRYWKYLTEKQG